MTHDALKIAVIGASGHIGRVVAQEALSRGHEVTAIARDTSRLEDLHGATVASADVLPRAGVSRLLFVGGGGSLEVAPGKRFVDTPQFPQQYREEALAQADALATFRNSDGAVDWSYASPPPMHLLDGEKTGTYRVQAGDRPVTDDHGESRITVADYASAIVDEAENGAFIRERFTVGY